MTTLDHPNIIKYYETYDDAKYMYLVMEYCSNGELFDLMTKQKDQTFSEKAACRIMEKLFKAIVHCHTNGIIHRDIKPENIMVGNDGEIKLIDFGLAKKNNSKTHTIAGTPYYMAPDIFKGKYNEKCDI